MVEFKIKKNGTQILVEAKLEPIGTRNPYMRLTNGDAQRVLNENGYANKPTRLLTNCSITNENGPLEGTWIFEEISLDKTAKPVVKSSQGKKKTVPSKED